MTNSSFTPLPVISRYVLREFARIFGLCLLGFLLIYVLVDFFDRLDMFLKHRSGLGQVLRYLLFKVPLIVAQMVPAATLGGVLLSLGVMARHNELTALRASGVSTLQIALPLLAVAAALSVGVLVWNESVVPYCSERSRQIELVEIRNKPLKALLKDTGMWFHGKAGIYSVEHFDAPSEMVIGMTIYEFTPGFELRRLIEISLAQWRNHRWVLSGILERSFDANGEIVTRRLKPKEFVLPDPPQDFQVMEKRAEELSFWRLRNRIQELSRKGIDTTASRVDLHLKLALPFIPLVMVLIGVPLSTHNPRRRSLMASVGIGLMVGFSYWVLLALTVSLGHGGAIPPVLGAWTANAVFVALGAFLFLGTE